MEYEYINVLIPAASIATKQLPTQRSLHCRSIYPSVAAGDAIGYKELTKPMRKIHIKRNKQK
jgi:hypothetical protein